jgi:glycosyltransferase involved in cell wall biosynthesis
MIVNPHDSELETQIRKAIPQNVELVDYVPFDQMPHEFAQARAFLCTGSPVHEGFPNVLLQSAASHTPICSLSDFDDFLFLAGLGGFLLFLVFELAVVEDLADRRAGVWRDLYKVHACSNGAFKSVARIHDTNVIAFFINKPDFVDPDRVIGPRAGCRSFGLTAKWTTDGWLSYGCFIFTDLHSTARS